MTEINYYKHSKGFATNISRLNKALKILSVLREFGIGEGERHYLLLDIGTGSGEIARYLGEYFDVVSVDVIDQRTAYNGFKFIQLSGEKFPFADKSFDIVVSNHVIEHVADAEGHSQEMARILKDNGLVYLATPNRLWPWEVHNGIPLLHYLPAGLFNRLLKILGRHREDIFLLTWWAFRRKMKKKFSVSLVSDRICKWPLRYNMQCHPHIARILSWVPLWVYRLFIFINPTFVAVLRK